MSETHYLISDASKKVDVESHVLRYWEEELEMAIPRNEMGHRYYTDFHIRLFKQIKELKEKGYQLKAIKAALAKSLDQDGEAVIPTDVLEEDVVAALKECTDQESREMEKLVRKEMETVLNIPADTPYDLFRIFRHEKAIPQYEADSAQRYDSIDSIEKRYPGLILAGNIRDGIGMPDRIRQGRQTAARMNNILKRLADAENQ